MDKKSIIGLLLIGGILIGWMLLNQPSKEEIAKRKAQIAADSISQYEAAEAIKKEAIEKAKQAVNTPEIALLSSVNDSTGKLKDSIRLLINRQKFGEFAESAIGENKIITLENDVLKMNISSRGGRIRSVELKKYSTYDKKPLILFNGDSTIQNISLNSGGKDFTTDSLYFIPEGKDFKITGSESKSIAFRAYAGSRDKYIEYVYTLRGDEYMLDFKINSAGLKNVLTNKGSIVMNWGMKTPMQEQDKDNQARNSTIYFKYPDEHPDKISESTYESQLMENPVKWIGFKQQFFTSVLIADNTFDKGSKIETINDHDPNYVKQYKATISIPYNESVGMRMYFGPNHFKTLKKYDLELEKQINLGWKLFGWINRLITIPLFNALDTLHLNYGIIILILTLILKLLLLPIAYKTVLSSAKMRVMKPEIDELNEKHKNDDPIKKQQATMALYKSAGVNPMAGCVPVLLQMPILIALFNFFPASIELRQQGFLWATDLSTYDSIWTFGYVPIISSIYGDHVSLFALLMTISTLIYTWSNSQLMGSNNQMPGMKWMMYLMPIMFLGFMNSYSAGLSWYYFLANMFTFGQTWIMQKFVIDHDKLHAQIQENKKKPVKQNKFQQRLEQMVKERQQQGNQPRKK